MITSISIAALAILCGDVRCNVIIMTMAMMVPVLRLSIYMRKRQCTVSNTACAAVESLPFTVNFLDQVRHGT